MVATITAEINGKAETDLILPDLKTWRETRETWDYLYHDLKFNLVPVAPSTKATCKTWKDLQTERLPVYAYRDGWINWKHEFVRQWSCNMALLTGWGPENHVVVVDPDDPEAEALVEGRCPATPMRVRTGKGTEHRYYRHPGPDPRLDPEGRISQILGATIGGRKYKLDVKADGNYVIAPGSLHHSGRLYTWVEPFTREMLANLPVYDRLWLPHERTAQKHLKSGKEGELPEDGWRDLDHEEFVHVRNSRYWRSGSSGPRPTSSRLRGPARGMGPATSASV